MTLTLTFTDPQADPQANPLTLSDPQADVQHQRTKHQEMSTMVTRLQMTNERTQNEAISNKDEINKVIMI